MRMILYRGGYRFSEKFRYPYNINQEEHRSYLKKIQRAEAQLASTPDSISVPRRKRRIFDRPRLDFDITGYGAWRTYLVEEQLLKIGSHSLRVLAKISLQPKWLLHAFGMGSLPPHKRKALREFYFQDVNMSQFILYQYGSTTAFKPNIPNYDYENQQHLHPNLRKVKRVDPQDFWNSEEYYDFRLNGSNYAEHNKFKKWITEQVEKRKSEQSYDAKIDAKFGKICTFNDKSEASRFVPNKPMITSVTPEHFFPGKKGKSLSQPKVRLGKKMQEKYRLKSEQSQTEQKETA